MLRVSVGLIRISPQRKLHKSLKCQTLRYHHSQQMGFSSRRLSFVVFFFVAILLGPAAPAPMPRTDMQLFKAALQKEKLSGQAAPQTKLNQLCAGAAPTRVGRSRSPGPRCRISQLTSGGPPFNTGARRRRRRGVPIPSAPGPTPTRAPNYPASATRATSLIRSPNNGGGLRWP